MQQSQAIDLYMIRHHRLPPEDGWAQALYDEGISHSPEVPLDPWGHPIIFEHREYPFELMSVGSDGVRGTEDDQVSADGWKDHGPCRAPPGSFCG